MCLALRSQSRHRLYRTTYQDQSTPSTWPYLMLRFLLDLPYAIDASPTALSLGYIVDSDPEDESEDGLVDYPANGGSDDDDDLSRDDTPIPFPSKAEVDRLLALPTPPPSPLTSLSSLLPQIPLLPTSTTYAQAPLGYRADADIPEAVFSPQKRLCLTAPIPRFEVGESLTAATARQPGLGDARTTDYGFVDMVDDAPRRHKPRVTELTETHERDTQDLYAHLEDA
ncbi:hypothetical protein Tco_0209608 [Tanacetum coccineum]